MSDQMREVANRLRRSEQTSELGDLIDRWEELFSEMTTDLFRRIDESAEQDTIKRAVQAARSYDV